MTTAEYVNWVLKRTGYQGTPEEIRVLVNIAQNEIFSYNTYFNKVKPESSCILETQDGVQQYVISDGLIRQVSRVYYYDSYDDKVDVSVDTTQSIDVNDNVIIMFSENPGDTTDKFYYEAYTWPTNGQITSLSIPLSLPEKVQTSLLFYMVSEMLEVDKDGRSIYNEEEKQKRLKDYFTFANQGATTEPSTPIILGV